MEDEIQDSPDAATSRPKAVFPISPNKRALNLTGSQFALLSPPDTEGSSTASSTMGHNGLVRPSSPAMSTSSLSSIDTLKSDMLHPSGLNTSSSTSMNAVRPAKRRKLTAAEKVQKQQEAEAREQERAARKAQREKEKVVKDEEKRVKDEEKRKKAEDREDKRRTKELEEERKAQEKLKKERSQMRLGAFFQSKPTADGACIEGAGTRRSSLSLEPFDEERDLRTPTKPSTAVNGHNTGPQASDTDAVARPQYSTFFLPFEAPSHSTVAHVFRDCSATVGEPEQNFDKELQRQHSPVDDLSDGVNRFKQRFGITEPSDRGAEVLHVRSVVDQINGLMASEPIDLTEESPLFMNLQTITRKILYFGEDVRPPYFGTYTKIRQPHEKMRLSRNPFVRARKDTNYDHDSEAEYEEPDIDDAESEGLSGDDEDDAESLGDEDEMEGFLDDDDDPNKPKRRNPIAELQPVSTGICWMDRSGELSQVASRENEASDSILMTTSEMDIRILLPGHSNGGIDPFSATYWQKHMAPPALPRPDDASRSPSAIRPPLKERNGNGGTIQQTLLGAAQGEKGPITSIEATLESKRGRKPAPKVLDADDMASFKDAVNGSPLAKVDLLKGLKQRFPKLTNDTIKDTLSTYFAQQGTGKMKRWIFTGSLEAIEASAQKTALGC